MALLRRLPLLLVLLTLLCLLPSPSNAQQSLDSTSPRPSSSLSLSNSSSILPSPTTNLSSSSAAPSSTLSPSSTALSPTNSSIAAPPPPPFLDTRIEGWSAALGALLILSGLSLMLWGVKSRWTSFFLVGFWTAATVIGLLILRLGVENAINPPSASTRGLFLFASLAGGVILGGACVIWWSGAHYLCGSMGGFSVGLFILEPLSSKWTNYLTSRRIFVDDREKSKPPRHSFTSDFENGRRSPAPVLPLPRPLSTALPRAPSPATLPRPISSATLSPLPRPSSSYDFPSAEATTRPNLASRHSSSLSRPLSLAFPSDLALLDAPANRRRTMIDLSEDDVPLGEALCRDRRRTMQGMGATEERIIVADWQRKEVAQPKPAKIMGMAELEAKKRKALGQIQASASADAKAAAFKAHYEQKQQREAAEQRRRSFASTAALKSTRRNSVGTLLDRLGGSSSPSPSRSASADRFDSGRRDSSPAVLAEQPPMLGERGRTRSVPLATRRESARLSGIEKVDDWKRRSSMMDVRVDEVATKVAEEKPKKKHDWLGY